VFQRLHQCFFKLHVAIVVSVDTKIGFLHVSVVVRVLLQQVFMVCFTFSFL
jgi:hypothetical protein